MVHTYDDVITRQLEVPSTLHHLFLSEYLQPKLELVEKQLLERFALQSARTVKNFPFLMKQGVWLDSEKLGENDKLEEVLKHGTLSIGFIGLAETLRLLVGKHHGESEFAEQVGLSVIRYMREFCDAVSQEKKLNFTLLATPSEGLCARFSSPRHRSAAPRPRSR